VSIQSQVVMVTPQMAQKWLSNGGKNRNISISKVKEYADSMNAGKWVLNGVPIIFDIGGKLIDGQHRLSAIALSGITMPMNVTRGIDDPRSFGTIDIGKKRTISDIAQMDGILNSRLATAIAKRLVAWNKYEDKSMFTLTSETFKKIANYEILDYLETNNHTVQFFLSNMVRTLPYRRCGAPSALVASIIICNEIDEVATMLFMEGLKTGANLPEKSPIHLLRERLIDPPERTSRLFWETEIMAITIKSWNKYLHGKELRTLKWIQDGDHPEKFPVPGDSK